MLGSGSYFVSVLSMTMFKVPRVIAQMPSGDCLYHTREGSGERGIHDWGHLAQEIKDSTG